VRVPADTWLAERAAVRWLKPKTASEYQPYLVRLTYPTLGQVLLKTAAHMSWVSWP